jgi:glycosyltransferase involved in cell wall biosynthesis
LRPPIKLSVIVPFYNEQDSIGALHTAIVDAVAPLQIPFEMVFVDDGSKDQTLARAVELARKDHRIRVVQFRRNYGQTAAMAAGIEYARGEVLVTMDGDLQNDPADIEQFLRKIDAGYDVVVGWRHDRQDKLVSRKVPSVIANWLIGKVTGIPIKDNGCSLKAYRASVIKNIRFVFRDAPLHTRHGFHCGEQGLLRSRSGIMPGALVRPNMGYRESTRCCST